MMKSMVCLTAGLLLLRAIADKMKMPEFPGAWQISRASVAEEHRENQTVLMLEGQGSSAKASIARPIPDRKIKLTVWLKGTENLQWVSVDTKAWRTVGGKEIPAQCRVNLIDGYVTTEYARVSTDWKAYEKTINVSRSAERVTISIQNLGRGALYASSPSFALGARELADLDGPGVIRSRINVWVKPGAAKKGMISFPVPGVDKDQVPLAFKFDTEPAGVVKSFKFVRRSDGLNWICEAQVEPGGAATRVSWEALTLVRDRAVPSLPRAAKPEVTREGRPWLARTTCVQTDSAVLIAKANELAEGSPDVETYVRRVIAFTCANRGTGAPFNRLDAEYAMACGGSCTSRANLAAALLRIKGIPTRTVAHLPTWALGEPLFTHWLAEYWHPGVGWIPVETTWGEFEPPRSSYVSLATSSATDENGSENEEQLRWVMPGAAEWTMARLGSDLAPDQEQNQQENWARPEVRLTGNVDALFERARSQFDRLLRSGEYGNAAHFRRVEAAMRSGRAEDLAR